MVLDGWAIAAGFGPAVDAFAGAHRFLTMSGHAAAVGRNPTQPDSAPGRPQRAGAFGTGMVSS
jgi:hypothetical protein